MVDTGNQVAQMGALGLGSVHRSGEGPGFVEVRNGSNVSRLPLDQQKKLLLEAERHGWSSDELRAKARELKKAGIE